MTGQLRETLREWAFTYNDPQYFQQDPIAFPTHFSSLEKRGERCLKDIEVSGVFAAHFAWGRRAMIVRDCNRLFDVMDWKPYDYVMKGNWKADPSSIHRTVKWCDVASICERLREYYLGSESLEDLGTEGIRCRIFGQKQDPKAPDKKIRMMQRWFVRNDGKVDLGIWKNSSPASLVLPLDVHVYSQATALGLTQRKQKDLATALEITEVFRDIFPEDPCLGDFALFGYGVTHGK